MAADSETAPERSRDVDRLLTFIDAIVAIAITLLVLPLADLAGEVQSDDSVWHFVQHNAGKFGGFVLSFVVIARLWLAQHRIVRGVVEPRSDFTACIIAWTLTIVFLPFPTALLAHTGDQAATKIIYIGTLMLSSLLLALLALTARRQQEPNSALRPKSSPAVADAAVFAIALILSVAVSALSYWPLLLLFLAEPARRMIRRGPPSARAR